MKTISIITVLALAVSAQAQTNAPAANVTEPVIVEKAADSTSAAVSAPAATSTTTAAAVTPAKSAISGGFLTEIIADASEANYDLGKAGLSTTNIFSIGYKFNDKQKMKAEQYVFYTKASEFTGAAQEDAELGATRWSFTQSGFKALGSDEFAIPVRVVIPTHETNIKKGQNYGVNLPIEIPWTINSKVTLSTLLYPRYVNYVEDADSLLGGEAYGIAYYQNTEAIQSYASVGTQNHMNMKNNNQVSAAVNSKHRGYEPNLMLEVGLNVNLPANIYLNPRVSQTHVVAAGATSDFELGQESEVSYLLTGAISF